PSGDLSWHPHQNIQRARSGPGHASHRRRPVRVRGEGGAGPPRPGNAGRDGMRGLGLTGPFVYFDVGAMRDPRWVGVPGAARRVEASETFVRLLVTMELVPSRTTGTGAHQRLE